MPGKTEGQDMDRLRFRQFRRTNLMYCRHQKQPKPIDHQWKNLCITYAPGQLLHHFSGNNDEWRYYLPATVRRLFNAAEKSSSVVPPQSDRKKVSSARTRSSSVWKSTDKGCGPDFPQAHRGRAKMTARAMENKHLFMFILLSVR